MTREEVFAGLEALRVSLVNFGLHPQGQNIRSIKDTVEYLKGVEASQSSQVWLVTVRNTDEGTGVEMPMLFNGNLLDATAAAIRYFAKNAPNVRVDSVRRIGVGVEVER